MENKWSLFKLRVNIRQPLDKVYTAWATPAGIESWFLRRAEIALGPAGIHRLPEEFMEAGDHYAWYWHGYADTVVEKGRIFYLTNLKSVLEGGLDLRNRRAELTNVITA